MINEQLLNPRHIAVIGGSSNLSKPGGKLVHNILSSGFCGKVFVVNPKENEVKGTICCASVSELPEVDMAVLAIPAKACETVAIELIEKKNTRAFVIISAGFSEESSEGAEMEHRLTEKISAVNGCLIGPNCIGVMTFNYNATFTATKPQLDAQGCDFISGSGATAVFIIESAIPKGLKFASVYSVGNSAQVGVEDLLEYMDRTYDPETSPRVKMLYIESVKYPDKLLKHASSLIRKGCGIVAIKSGASEAGSRAASSHTGAMASSDLAVDALFRKAGIVRCHGREELVTAACVLMHKPLTGKRIAIVTHAGGPAVMLTDALSEGGLEIPRITGSDADELLSKLLPGSSVSNPIDFLATGTPEQLGLVMDYCDQKFDNIDAMMVIFGSTGLHHVFDAYEVLHQKMQTCKKPVFPILPALLTAQAEVESFLAQGHINFPDEVLLGKAVTKVYNTPKPAGERIELEGVDVSRMRNIIDNAADGFLPPDIVRDLLSTANIPLVAERIVTNREELKDICQEFCGPLVMKIIGPVHKTDVGGVSLNIKTEKHLYAEFDRMNEIPGYKGVLIQPMLKGTELFIGAHYEPRFGHLILCGLGGIFVEALHDISAGLAPLTYPEAYSMIRSLRSYSIIKGTRGQKGIDEDAFADVIVRLSSLLRFATEIKELDMNPLIATNNGVTVVDARIRIEKTIK
jgi:acetyltransferase